MLKNYSVRKKIVLMLVVMSSSFFVQKTIQNLDLSVGLSNYKTVSAASPYNLTAGDDLKDSRHKQLAVIAGYNENDKLVDKVKTKTNTTTLSPDLPSINAKTDLPDYKSSFGELGSLYIGEKYVFPMILVQKTINSLRFKLSDVIDNKEDTDAAGYAKDAYDFVKDIVTGTNVKYSYEGVNNYDDKNNKWSAITKNNVNTMICIKNLLKGICELESQKEKLATITDWKKPETVVAGNEAAYLASLIMTDKLNLSLDLSSTFSKTDRSVTLDALISEMKSTYNDLVVLMRSAIYGYYAYNSSQIRASIKIAGNSAIEDKHIAGLIIGALPEYDDLKISAVSLLDDNGGLFYGKGGYKSGDFVAKADILITAPMLKGLKGEVNSITNYDDFEKTKLYNFGITSAFNTNATFDDIFAFLKKFYKENLLTLLVAQNSKNVKIYEENVKKVTVDLKDLSEKEIAYYTEIDNNILNNAGFATADAQLNTRVSNLKTILQQLGKGWFSKQKLKEYEDYMSNFIDDYSNKNLNEIKTALDAAADAGILPKALLTKLKLCEEIRDKLKKEPDYEKKLKEKLQTAEITLMKGNHVRNWNSRVVGNYNANVVTGVSDKIDKVIAASTSTSDPEALPSALMDLKNYINNVNNNINQGIVIFGGSVALSVIRRIGSKKGFASPQESAKAENVSKTISDIKNGLLTVYSHCVNGDYSQAKSAIPKELETFTV